jgi:hypothetical protein
VDANNDSDIDTDTQSDDLVTDNGVCLIARLIDLFD